jgi:hypothetical protein
LKKVYVVDSNYPEDHFLERADGIIVQHVLRALGIRADLKLALDREHFRKAVGRAIKAGCDVIHVSTHGNEDGIAVCNDTRGSSLPQGFEWPEFVELFQCHGEPPEARHGGLQWSLLEVGQGLLQRAKAPENHNWIH